MKDLHQKQRNLFITQSLIKTMFYKFNELPDEKICYRKIYAQYVLGMRTESSDANLKGLLFEDLCYDTNHNKVSFPRHARTGQKLTDEKRIEAQAHIFKEWVREVDGVANAENSQIIIYKRWERDRNVILRGKLDCFPFIFLDPDNSPEEDGYVLSILDNKFTANLDSTYGKFCWGEPTRMDHLQAIFYSYLVVDIDYDLNDKYNPNNKLRELTESFKHVLDAYLCQFRYYVADCKPSYSSQVINYKLKPDDLFQLHEVIRKTVRLLRVANEEEWPTNPSTSNCLGNPMDGVYKCPFVNCSKRKKEVTI